MNKYLQLLDSLQKTGRGQMKCHGNSMLPRLSNPSLCEYEQREGYGVGDIVFCKVQGRYIDAHLITAVQNSRKRGQHRYLISNNHGHDNGWTEHVFGKVVRATDHAGQVKEFA